MNERISKKIENGNFYLIALLLSLFLFYFLQVVVMNIGVFVIDFRSPGFATQFTEEVAAGNFGQMSEYTLGIFNMSQFIGEIILAGIMVAFLGKELIKDYKRFKEKLGYHIFVIISGFVILYLLNYGLTLIYEELGIRGTSDNQQAIEMALAASTGIFMLLAVILLAPFVEEIIFRKLLFGVVEEKLKFPPILAIIISAIIFAAIHAIDVFFFQYFAMAIVLCGSYSLFKNNIYIPMGIHLINNSTVLFFIAIKVFS